MNGRKHNRTGRRAKKPRQRAGGEPIGLRIVGGRFRGSKLHYAGDRRVRPMKDRLREAVFNLVGPSVRGKHAIDLFAGTGALGLEAISRGARRATLIEQHVPTVATIRRNVEHLGVESLSEVVTGSVFVWAKRQPELDPGPWVVFCSPPYDFYLDRTAEMTGLIVRLIESAPPESIFVVEADVRFHPEQLPEPNAWDVRSYPPAVVAIYRKPA
ncbi:MAG: RsmD family RNA methyltransferase [Planctomycetes bacterium]|nr:RsmD family RNA methyltransferase [Planctomycetota bacterium]